MGWPRQRLPPLLSTGFAAAELQARSQAWTTRQVSALCLLWSGLVLAALVSGSAPVWGQDVATPLPPGPMPQLIETPLCSYFQNVVCEFRFGPDRRLRIPTDLLHPAGVGHAQTPTGGIESGLVRTTWGRLRMMNGQVGSAPGDEAWVQVLFQSDPRQEIGSLEGKLRVFAPDQLPAVVAARAQGDATLTFADRDGDQWEVVFRNGRVATERQCNRNNCSVLLVGGGVFLKFSYDRRIKPTTEDAVALVEALFDTFVVEGPKLQEGKAGR